MTYARARLVLGMSGVGCIVVASTLLLLLKVPQQLLPVSQTWSLTDIASLFAIYGALVAATLPLDFLGGFLLPNRWRPATISFSDFGTGWFRGVVVQGVIFLASSLCILFMGRWLGLPGALLAVVILSIVLLAAQLTIAKYTGGLSTSLAISPESDASVSDALVSDSPIGETVEKRPGLDSERSDREKMATALATVTKWGWKPRKIAVLEHRDTGFTGGVTGLPGLETVVLPSGSLSTLSPQQLAATVARRIEAIDSGSRTRGLLLALLWVAIGFALSTLLPGAGVTSVSELGVTCLGFTLWTFLGLLTLPTVSRQATFAIDGKLLQSGVSPETFSKMLRTLDALQDDEPHRSAVIETIFHPVPSVDNRRNVDAQYPPIAWHAARITLFASWACMGLLVRAVHCNVGRPELWVMLPTD